MTERKKHDFFEHGYRVHGPLLQIYNKIVGIASVLLILVTIVYHGAPLLKDFNFGG